MHIIPHAFNRYEMTGEEALASSILTLSNQAMIQNLLAEKSEAKLALQVDVQNVNAYIQEEAYLKGQIEILQYLLQQSTYAEQVSKPSHYGE